MAMYMARFAGWKCIYIIAYNIVLKIDEKYLIDNNKITYISQNNRRWNTIDLLYPQYELSWDIKICFKVRENSAWWWNGIWLFSNEQFWPASNVDDGTDNAQL